MGLSAIKGLAETLQKPIATVSLLEALAASSARPGKIAAAMDAGRAEVFLGVYDVREVGGGMAAEHQGEELLSQSAFIERLGAAQPASVLSSETTLCELADAAGIPTQLVTRPGSEAVARMGARKLLAGDVVSVETLDANYLRRSDAEIFFKGQR